MPRYVLIQDVTGINFDDESYVLSWQGTKINLGGLNLFYFLVMIKAYDALVFSCFALMILLNDLCGRLYHTFSSKSFRRLSVHK